MLTPIKNILWENKREFGMWGYLLLIPMIPMYFTAKIFGIHNKSYEMKNYYTTKPPKDQVDN